MKISGTIITLNEEKNIERAIRSLAICDQVVVVDSGSSDATTTISEKLGATVIQNDWPGYAKQKNFVAESAEHDWILSIDADEEVSPALAGEIEQLKRDSPEFQGYDFPRLARYCGQWIRHSGWYPDRKVRLYHRDAARWVGDYVHESVELDGPSGHLDADLLHYTCDSIEEHRETIERYTDLAAEELRAQRRTPGVAKRFLSPPAAFVKSYILQQGFRDGAAGWTIARMAAYYVHRKYQKASAV